MLFLEILTLRKGHNMTNKFIWDCYKNNENVYHLSEMLFTDKEHALHVRQSTRSLTPPGEVCHRVCSEH